MASIGRLAAGVAHEANNPLAYVIGNLNFLKEEPAELSDRLPSGKAAEIKQVIAESTEGALRVKRIVRDLYSFSRTQTDERAQLNINEEIDRVVPTTARVTKESAQVIKILGETPRL